MSVRRAVAHTPDGTSQAIDPSTIDTIIAEKRALLWLDIEGPDLEDIELLRCEFGFHELALEDALRGDQRPKLDEYEGYYFIVLYTARWSGESVVTEEIHSFWGKNYVVTLHEHRVPEIDNAVARWSSNTAHRQHGVAFQMYSLLDEIIDGYFPVMDGLAERIDEIELHIFDGDGDLIRDIFALRHAVTHTRRVLAPSRDVLNQLIRRDIPVFPPALIPYLADVYDHSIRVIDQLDLDRDLLATAVESHLSVTSNRLNQTVRTMTALTIGLMVPTLIAGIYGMNFRIMPELEWTLGYPMSLVMMAGTMALLFLIFKKVGWL